MDIHGLKGDRFKDVYAGISLLWREERKCEIKFYFSYKYSGREVLALAWRWINLG